MIKNNLLERKLNKIQPDADTKNFIDTIKTYPLFVYKRWKKIIRTNYRKLIKNEKQD